MDPTPSSTTFPCQGCGSQLAYAPGTNTLVCVHCGLRQDIERSPALDTTLDLRHALSRGVGDAAQRPPGGVVTLRCDGCGATFQVPATLVTARCDYCASHKLVQHDQPDTTLAPALVVPFVLDDRAAAQRFHAWLGGLWFRPSNLRTHQTVADLHAIYTPYWLFDARLPASWTAERGDASWVDEETTGSDGKRSTQRVRKVTWSHVRGSRNDAFKRWQVCGSAPLRGRLKGLTDVLGPFPEEALSTYDPRFLAGFRAERYSVDLPDAWKLARSGMEEEVTRRCANDVGGDEQRNLVVRATPQDERVALALLPLHVLAYRYQAKVYNVLIHGVTGVVRGQAPWSIPKLAALAGAVVGVLVAIWWFWVRHPR